ncbi:unnamed protein product [Phytophthora fragariaefolia]|uniref:Unnamed protein product n=1 Tax=Phytophthora fragariaefolia TaxID=1490495 RepID=A0A9W6XYG1_9STRA|nr:unnamed protein product [Phytophthora fragariaefolia]
MLSACCIAASSMFAPTLDTSSIDGWGAQAPQPNQSKFEVAGTPWSAASDNVCMPQRSHRSSSWSSVSDNTKTPTTRLVTATDADVTLGCALFASDSRGDKRKVEVSAVYGHAEVIGLNAPMGCRHEVTCDNARRHSSPRKKRSEPGAKGGPVGDERNEAADEVTHAAHPEKLNGERYRCGAPKNVGKEDGVRNGNAGRTRLDGVHTSDTGLDLELELERRLELELDGSARWRRKCYQV